MTDHRSDPRRRGDELVQAIYDAVLAELDEHGYAAVTMESVAQRARTGKASLYRRWPTRLELILDAIHSRVPIAELMIDTGSLRSDLMVIFERFADELAGPLGKALRGVWAESLGDEEHHRRVQHYSRHSGRRLMQMILDRAVARGEIDPAVITDQRLEAGPAILRYRLLLDGRPFEVAELIEEVVLPLFTATVPPDRPRPQAAPAG